MAGPAVVWWRDEGEKKFTRVLSGMTPILPGREFYIKASNPTCAESVVHPSRINHLAEKSALHLLRHWVRRSGVPPLEPVRLGACAWAARCRADRVARLAPRQAG